MNVNIPILFSANAIVLFVTALAFFAAWLGQRDEAFWPSWIAANVTIAVALIFFIAAPAEQDGLAIAFANCMLVGGLGLRWRAARQFGRRSSPLLPVFGPVLCVAALFSLPSVFGHGAVYISTNAILAILSGASAYEFWRDRNDGLPSRYGLLLAYGLLALSFALRAGQAVVFSAAVTSYLPLDLMLQAHMFVALLHSTASGAFALSIAYERSMADLREAALRDPLTGIYNRRGFAMHLQQQLDAGGSDPFAVVIFDVDHFKRVNDCYGHVAGDAALCVCAETIAQSFRPTDFVARIGGEEFAAILPGISATKARELIDRVRRRVAMRDIVSHGSRFRITLSGGFVHSSSGLANVSALMKAADAGLYRAKHAGRNRVEQPAGIVPESASLVESTDRAIAAAG